MGLLDVGVRHFLETPQRREEQRRYEEQWGEEGWRRKQTSQRFKLDEKIHNQNVHEFGKKVKRWDADRGMKRTEDETRRIEAAMGIVMRTMSESPENVQQASDTFLKPLGYDFTFEPTEDPAIWKGGVTDQGLFWRMNLSKPLDEGGLEVSDKREETGLGGVGKDISSLAPDKQITSLLKGMKAEIGQWGTADDEPIGGETDPFAWLQRAAKSENYQNLRAAAEKGEPRAIQSLKNYEWMMNRILEILGVPGPEPPPGPEVGRPLREQQQQEFAATLSPGRLGQIGQPTPQGQGRPLDRETAQWFLEQAGGDPELARQMAREQGYAF